MTLYTEVPNLKTVKNSTPHYTSNPNTLLCVNNLFEYNMNFVDDDGDELRYSLIEPINGWLDKNDPVSNTPTAGPYPNVVWGSTYNNNDAIHGDVPLTIHPSTGKITCNPSAAGIYVASIRVEEFRFGVKIGELRFELQMTVTVCPNNPPVSSISKDGMIVMEDTVYVNIPDSFCFKVRAVDPSDSLYLRISSDSLDSLMIHKPYFDTLSSGYKLVETTICWQGSCEHEKFQKTVPFYVHVYDNGCPISRKVDSKIWVKFRPMPLVNSTDLLCMSLVNNAETFVYYGDSTDPADPYFDSYLVYKGINYQNYSVIDTIPNKLGRVFHDRNTPNYGSINYTYFMRGLNKCGNFGPSSDTLSTFEQLSFVPQKQYLKYVTVVDNDHLELEWPASTERDFAKYFLYKSTRGKNKFDLLATFEDVNETKFIDNNVKVSDTSYCYYLVMKDTCENIGPNGLIACSMVLRGRSSQFTSHLNWQDYLGWEEGVGLYQVHRSDPASPFAKIGQSDSLRITYIDDKLNLNEGLFYYYIVAKQFDNGTSVPFTDAESMSNTIELYQPPIVYTPNAFSANGDGLNDEFRWLPVFVKDFHIQIYNRWGQMIFETNNKNQPWDGKVNGNEVSADVYFYRMRYTGWEGSDKSQTGNFTILR
jgi:gliding motility-associated-like protein